MLFFAFNSTCGNGFGAICEIAVKRAKSKMLKEWTQYVDDDVEINDHTLEHSIDEHGDEHSIDEDFGDDDVEPEADDEIRNVRKSEMLQVPPTIVTRRIPAHIIEEVHNEMDNEVLTFDYAASLTNPDILNEMKERNLEFFDPEEVKAEIQLALEQRCVPMCTPELVDNEVRRIWAAGGLTRKKIFAGDRSNAIESIKKRESLELRFTVETRRQNLYNLKYGTSSISS